ncbi:putative metal binding protein [Ranid herpesvirus 3]|uniref:Putative metal binding protein n=1 Tax=Ranid herpesvirus 3 TaxID=1987509 RepID=A0A1X9T5J6_9VIRU|nr:putative metal binding protein [Ranid herpesvirus 3]ARR28978.1 putative metal binding protein [Ranid herpesvirus 3]
MDGYSALCTFKVSFKDLHNRYEWIDIFHPLWLKNLQLTDSVYREFGFPHRGDFWNVFDARETPFWVRHMAEETDDIAAESIDIIRCDFKALYDAVIKDQKYNAAVAFVNVCANISRLECIILSWIRNRRLFKINEWPMQPIYIDVLCTPP